jgi:hypothetical protein
MKNIIPIESSSSVITNSSSEIFICNTSKSKEEVESMLDTICSTLDQDKGCSIKSGYGKEDLLKEILGILDYVEYYGINSILSLFIPYTEKGSYPSLLKHDFNSTRNLTSEEYWEHRTALETNNTENITSWFEQNSVLLDKYVKDFIVIDSDSDNSIPYDIFDLIERRLNGVRYHLG